MGAPIKNMTPADEASADALLTSLRTIAPAERRKHASVFNYWLSIRGKRQLPAIRDLDPLEISDAGPFSLLMEMIGGGDDAEIRHFGHAIKGGDDVHRISDAEAPSLLSCIHAKLPVVASSRQAFAFEDRFDSPNGPRRCWVTLLPLSANGTWIDFVYGFVSLDGADAAGEAEAVTEAATPVSSADEAAETFKVELRPYDEHDVAGSDLGVQADFSPDVEPEAEFVVDLDPFSGAQAPAEPEPEDAPFASPDPEPEMEPVVATELDPEPEFQPGPEFEPEPSSARPAEAGFSSKLLAGLASVSGFYGKVVQGQPVESEAVEQDVDRYEESDAETADRDAVQPDPIIEPEPEAEPEPEPEPEFEPEPEPEPEPTFDPEPQQATASPAAMEASLQDKLSGVRAMAEEARKAQERSNMALYEGLGAAYDFALDAEEQPEEYLRLVETQGLKIQLRSPMKPVVKLAFSGLTDDHTIGQLEAVLAWALKSDLPRGSLAERIVAEGGIGPILNGKPS